MMTARAVAALTDLVRELRPDWHRPGIVAALRASDEHDPHLVALALNRRAANPANRTPQMQRADYDDTTTTRCPVGASGNWPHGLCAGCCVTAGTLLDPTERPIEPFVVVPKPYDLASPYGQLRRACDEWQR